MLFVTDLALTRVERGRSVSGAVAVGKIVNLISIANLKSEIVWLLRDVRTQRCSAPTILKLPNVKIAHTYPEANGTK